MRYPTRKDLNNMADVLREMNRRGVDGVTFARLQAVVAAYEHAGQWAIGTVRIHGGSKK